MRFQHLNKLKNFFYSSELQHVPSDSDIVEKKISDLSGNLFLHREVVNKRELPVQEFVVNKNEDEVQGQDGNMKNIYKIASSFLTKNQLLFLGVVFNEMLNADFVKQSSVSLLSESNKRINEKYEILSRIDLLSHTINVLNKMILHSSELSSQNKVIIFFSALFHDFGKSKLLVKDIENHYYSTYGVTDKNNHSKFSALIFKKMVSIDNKSVFVSEVENLIFYTVFYHHDYEDKEIDGVIVGLIKFLIKIDIEARKDEIAFIKHKRKEEL